MQQRWTSSILRLLIILHVAISEWVGCLLQSG